MTVSGYLLGRIRRDARLAFYFDPFSESMELLTATYAAENGLDLEEFRKKYYASLRFEKPLCTECREAVAQ